MKGVGKRLMGVGDLTGLTEITSITTGKLPIIVGFLIIVTTQLILYYSVMTNIGDTKKEALKFRLYVAGTLLPILFLVIIFEGVIAEKEEEISRSNYEVVYANYDKIDFNNLHEVRGLHKSHPSYFKWADKEIHREIAKSKMDKESEYYKYYTKE